MKNLFFLALSVGIIPGFFSVLIAQNSVKVEKGISIKFIEGLELNPEPYTNAGVAVDERGKLNPISATTTPLRASHISSTIERCSPLQFKFAMLMDREVESIDNKALYNFIDEWWATRYRYGGSDRNGIDCSSFTVKLLSTVYGFSAPRTAKDQLKLCMELATSDLLEGDLVFFNTSGGISHVGVYLGNNYFVHSSVRDGVTISSLTDEYYSNKFITGGRIRIAQQL